MRDLIRFILEQQGAQVTVAASAAEAIMLFDRQPPNLFETSLNTTIKVAGDSARLQQIIWNLLANAVKFNDINDFA
ncbi:hypothetical protein F7734_49335 [Scytonema sp. UIC 10036]|nr:hypothetical protein [Scytonema sp. UIC 10036]